ncbi:hypothetical protein BDV06DRAFT_218777 [Aspergillus oleicola]
MYSTIGLGQPSLADAACDAVVARHPILRTVFVVHEQQTLNAVLKSREYKFIELMAEDDRDKQVEQLVEEVKRQSLALGQAFTKFMYISGGTEGSCLILRLSHAKYDGVSQPIIYHDLQAAYLEGGLSPSSSFSLFIHSKKAAETENSFAFWTKQLEGSQMTRFISKPQFIVRNGTIRTLSQSIPEVNLIHHGMTFATLIKTAWSMVLS